MKFSMFTIEEVKKICDSTPLGPSQELLIEKMDVASANELFLIQKIENNEKFCLKIYNSAQNRAAKAKENIIHDVIKPIYSSISTILYHGELSSNEYCISKHINGVSLLDAYLENISNERFINSISKQLTLYIDSCNSISTKKFGLVSDFLIGELNCWSEFVENNLLSVKKIVDGIPELNHNLRNELRPFVEVAQKFLMENHKYFSSIQPKLTPVDLNLTNFIVEANTNSVIAIDLEAFVSGDPLLSFGELFGHVYQTTLGYSLSHLWNRWTNEEKMAIHFYAFLSNLNVLSFIISNSNQYLDINTLKPWGNNNSFVNLLRMHQNHFTIKP